MYPSPPPGCNRMRSGFRPVALALPLVLLFSACISSQAVARQNPMLLLLKNSVYGSACGLLLGGVLTLVMDKDNRGDVVRWGVVVGTFSGFGYGIYELSAGSGYEEFTRRTRPVDSSHLAARYTGHYTEEPGYAPESVTIPLRLNRALGRSPVASADQEIGQLPARPGNHLIAAGRN